MTSRAHTGNIADFVIVRWGPLSMTTHWKFWLGLLLLVILGWIVEANYGWLQVISAWQAIPVTSVLLALLLMLTSYLLRAVRFYDFFAESCRGRFWLLLRITVLHNFFNNMLPMRSGEAAFPVLMKRHFSLKISHSAPALVWLRLLDLYALIALAGISLQVHLPVSNTMQYVVMAVLLLAPLLVLPVQTRLAQRLQNHPSPKVQKLASLMSALPDSGWAYTRALFWTLINWALKLAVYAWLLSRFMTLSWPQAWTGVSGGELSSILPIHGFAGAGTYEAGVVGGLLPWSVDANAALAAAVNLHLFILGTTLLLTGIIALLTHRADRSRSMD